MKLNCKIIEDLLPLYLDGICSEQSKEMVEEHLKECERCKSLINSTKTLKLPQIELQKADADTAVKTGFKKIRFRWWASIIIVIIIIPSLFLGWNQYHNTGIHYTNINEYRIGRAFMNELLKGNYQKAFGYIDIDGLKEEWSELWFDESELADIKEKGLSKFCEYAESIEIEDCTYVGISIHAFEADDTPVYQLLFKIRISDNNEMFCVNVSDDGVESFSGGGSFIDDPLARFSIWSEYLWQDYEGCYYDPNLKDYVYTNKQ